MNVNQQKNLQKIMLAFDKDYSLSEQLYDRQVELIESIRLHQLASTFDVVTVKGVRQEVLEAAKDSPEFEELMDAYRREAMAIIARWDWPIRLMGRGTRHESGNLFRYQQRGLPRR